MNLQAERPSNFYGAEHVRCIVLCYVLSHLFCSCFGSCTACLR